VNGRKKETRSHGYIRRSNTTQLYPFTFCNKRKSRTTQEVSLDHVLREEGREQAQITRRRFLNRKACEALLKNWGTTWSWLILFFMLFICISISLCLAKSLRELILCNPNWSMLLWWNSIICEWQSSFYSIQLFLMLFILWSNINMI